MTSGTASGGATERAGRVSARKRLLDAAEVLFYERGIAATGVDAVLRRAQVAPATLYTHFGGKAGLVAAYLEQRHQRWRQTWDAALDRAGDDPVGRVLSLFDALDDLQDVTDATRGCAFLGAAVEVVDRGHPAHAWLESDTNLLTTRLRQTAAVAGAKDPEALAAELLLVYDGVLAARARRASTPEGSFATDTTLSAARALADSAVRRHLSRSSGS